MKRPSKKPLKISEEQIRWAMSEAITDDGETQREYIADYYRCGPGEIVCTLQEAAQSSF